MNQRAAGVGQASRLPWPRSGQTGTRLRRWAGETPALRWRRTDLDPRSKQAFAAARSGFGRQAHDDIEARGKFANARSFERGERDRNGVALLLVLDTFPDAVLLVAGMALDVALGDELLFALHLDREMNVRRAPGVRHRFDGAEEIFAGQAGQEPAEALEVGVALVAVSGARVQVGAVGV